jgi:phosphatidylethanolamine-binding protein (PEBP) family uncharacterized protein
MDKRAASILVAVVALAALCGCGSSNAPSTSTAKAAVNTTSATTTAAPTNTATTPTSTPTTSTAARPGAHVEEHTPVTADVEISSPAVRDEGSLPAQYTCDGQDTALPLRWKGIPPGTAELALYILKVNPVNGKLFFDWAVTGLKPTTRGITAGKLPAGAVVGASSNGQTSYYLCPPKGPAEKYLAVLFALPHKLSAKAGFDATTQRLEAVRHANYEGFLFFTYHRH